LIFLHVSLAALRNSNGSDGFIIETIASRRRGGEGIVVKSKLIFAVKLQNPVKSTENFRADRRATKRSEPGSQRVQLVFILSIPIPSVLSFFFLPPPEIFPLLGLPREEKGKSVFAERIAVEFNELALHETIERVFGWTWWHKFGERFRRLTRVMSLEIQFRLDSEITSIARKTFPPLFHFTSSLGSDLPLCKQSSELEHTEDFFRLDYSTSW
jgi:hypothetical protein